MTLLFVFIALAFTAFTLFKTIAPFLGSRHGQLRVELIDDELRTIELLVARKAAFVQELRDIEYDWQTSKISEEDYKRFKTSNERRAIGIMRRLDAIHGGRAWEENIDNELAKRLAEYDANDSSETAAQHTEQPAEPITDSSADTQKSAIPTPESAVSTSEITCEQCQKPLSADDIFCAKCGHRAAQENSPQDSESFSQNSKNTTKPLRPEVTQ